MRPAAILGLVPAIWMIVQAVPVPVEGWINSISRSAAAALDVPPAGSTSIDPGMTLIALCHYLTAAVIVLMVAAVTIDRQRAELVLAALLVAATVIAAISLGYETLSWLGWIGHISPSMRGAMSDASVIGAILAVGAGFSAFERQQRTRDQAVQSAQTLARHCRLRSRFCTLQFCHHCCCRKRGAIRRSMRYCGSDAHCPNSPICSWLVGGYDYCRGKLWGRCVGDCPSRRFA